MSVQLPSFDASTFSRRRKALAQELGDTTALLFSGGMQSRNYAANMLPFRVHSHFLYLTGLSMADAAVGVSAEGTTLYVETPPADDALWHGAQPSPSEIAAAAGIAEVRPLSDLDRHKGKGARVGSLPVADLATRLRQARLLDRPWAEDPYAPLEGADARVADAMIGLRLIHDEAAVQGLRKAAEGTAAAHLAGMGITRVGGTEHEVRGAMEGAILSHGMVTAYPPIISTRGEVLHNMVHPYPLADGDMILADVGSEFEGWCGDVTRTWPVNGKFSPTQRTMYDLVLESQKQSIAMVKPGVRYRDIHLHGAKVITQGLVDEGILKGDVDNLVERGAHALFFPHGMGHIIGLDVHDMEDLGDRAGYGPGRERAKQFGLGHLRLDRDLEAGMMVTIEPGYYRIPALLADQKVAGPFLADGSLQPVALEKFNDVRGIRIEDDVLCTEGDPEILSAAIPKEVADVEAAVGC